MKDWEKALKDPNIRRAQLFTGKGEDPNYAAKQAAANKVRAAQARKKRKWWNPFTWRSNGQS